MSEIVGCYLFQKLNWRAVMQMRLKQIGFQDNWCSILKTSVILATNQMVPVTSEFSDVNDFCVGRVSENFLVGWQYHWGGFLHITAWLVENSIGNNSNHIKQGNYGDEYKKSNQDCLEISKETLLCAEMHVNLHVKCPLLLNFYQNWNVLTVKLPNIKFRDHSAVLELLHAYRQRHITKLIVKFL